MGEPEGQQRALLNRSSAGWNHYPARQLLATGNKAAQRSRFVKSLVYADHEATILVGHSVRKKFT